MTTIKEIIFWVLSAAFIIAVAYPLILIEIKHDKVRKKINRFNKIINYLINRQLRLEERCDFNRVNFLLKLYIRW